MYCLKGLLPELHIKCWQTFVLACQYLSFPVLTKTDILKADMLFVKFGERFEQLYGKKAVTPNMHLHCHLKECILDCGPVHAFWCFSFEHFDVILGGMQVNGRSVELQLMRKLLAGRFIWDVEFPNEFHDSFIPFFAQERNDSAQSLIVKTATKLHLSSSCSNVMAFQWCDLGLVSLPNTFEHFALGADELNLLHACYEFLYPGCGVEITSSVGCKYSSITLGSEKFGSKMDCRNLRSARVMASWSADDGSIDMNKARRPGVVLFYLAYSVKMSGQFYQHIFAVVWWHQADQDEGLFGKPIQVWKCEYSPCGPALFMPVQRIAQRFASCSTELNGMKKLVISPIPRSFN